MVVKKAQHERWRVLEAKGRKCQEKESDPLDLLSLQLQLIPAW